MDSHKLHLTETLFRRVAEALSGGPLPAAPAGDQDLARWIWLLNSAVRANHFRGSLAALPSSDAELRAGAAYLFAQWATNDDDRAKLEVVLYQLVLRNAGSSQMPGAAAIAVLVQEWLDLPPARGLCRTTDELRRARTTLDQCRSVAEVRISGLLGTISTLKSQAGQEVPRADVLAELVLLYASVEAALKRLHPNPDPATLDIRDLLESVDATSPAAAGDSNPAATARPATTGTLRADPLLDEGRLVATISMLVAALRTSEAGTTSIRLPNSELFLTALELHSLQTEFSSTEASFRAELNKVVRRAAGLRAYLQEELELYRSRRRTDHLWKKHLESAVYFAPVADRLILDVESFTAECGRRGLRNKAEDLGSISEELRKLRRSIAAIQESADEEPALALA